MRQRVRHKTSAGAAPLVTRPRNGALLEVPVHGQEPGHAVGALAHRAPCHGRRQTVQADAKEGPGAVPVPVLRVQAKGVPCGQSAHAFHQNASADRVPGVRRASGAGRHNACVRRPATARLRILPRLVWVVVGADRALERARRLGETALHLRHLPAQVSHAAADGSAPGEAHARLLRLRRMLGGVRHKAGAAGACAFESPESWQ